MRKKTAIFIGLFVSLLAGICYGQDFRVINPKFQRITIDQGLSQNSIQKILQSPRGFMWIATKDGLNRYDGYKFETYRKSAKSEISLSDNFIETIFFDSKGILWIGTNSGGLDKFDIENKKIVNIRLQCKISNTPAREIRDIIEDKSGYLWISTNGCGLFRYNLKDGSYQNFMVEIPEEENTPENQRVLRPSYNFIRNISIDKNGTILIGTNRKGMFELKDGKFQRNPRFKALNDKIITTQLIDKTGRLWIGTTAGLFVFGETGNRTYQINHTDKKSISSNFINKIHEDSAGRIWIATANGLDIYFDREDDFITFRNDPADNTSLSFNNISDLYEDKEGLLWIGTAENGINKLKIHNIRFRHFINQPSNNGLLNNKIARAVFQYNDRFILVGTLGGDLFEIDKLTGERRLLIKNEDIQNDYSSNSVTSIVRDNNGYFWMGTWERGLYKFRIDSVSREVKNLENVDLPEDFPGRLVQTVFFDSRGRFFVGGNRLMVYYPDGKFVILKYIPENPNSLPDYRVQSKGIAEDREGNIWIGTWNGMAKIELPENSDDAVAGKGIRITKFTENETERKISDNRIISIQVTNDNVVWAGTYGGGLNKIESAGTDKFRITHYDEEDGLSNNVIYAILEDNEGKLWVSTNKGISKFDPQNGSFVNYEESDGLQSNRFYWGAAFKSNKGEMIFGGTNGLTSFFPEKVTNSKFNPALYITGISIMNNPIISEKDISFIKEINVAHDSNFIRLEFSSLDFMNPSKNKYKYKMEGLDKDWVDAGNRNYAYYTDLKGGSYIFRVKASNNDGIWSSEEIALIVNVSTPWWETWFFRIFVVLLISLIVFVIFKTRLNIINSHNAQLRNEIENRKKIEEDLIIARDKAEKSDKLKSEFLAQISHEIRTPVNAIMSFTSLLRTDLEENVNDDLKEVFFMIENGGRRLIRTIDLLVNMSELQTGSYDASFEKISLLKDVIEPIMKDYITAASKKGLLLNLNFSAENDLILADDYTVTQIFSNLIDNAIKYTPSGLVEISVYNIGNELIAEVKDTGIGISEEYGKNLFMPFTQEEQGYTRKYEGNGLGLALVKKYCDLNHCNISVESKKNSGSIFTVCFKSAPKE